jgi:hypothetical protein
MQHSPSNPHLSPALVDTILARLFVGGLPVPNPIFLTSVLTQHGCPLDQGRILRRQLARNILD